MSKESLGLLLGAVGVTIFGITLPATRIAVQSFDPVFVTAGRAFIAGLLSAATLMATRRRLPDRRHWRRLALGALLLVGGFPIFMSLALTTAEASHGGVVLAVLPLATAVAATAVAGERPSLGFWALALLGAGLVLAFVLRRTHGEPTLADLLLLLAGASAALGYAASGGLSRVMPGWEVICWQLVLALPFTTLLVLWFIPGVNWQAPASAWAGFAYVSVFSMFLGFFAWNAGLGLGGVARVSQVQHLQTFVTLAASAILLGERVDAETIVFAAAVVAVVALSRRAQVARRSVEGGRTMRAP